MDYSPSDDIVNAPRERTTRRRVIVRTARIPMVESGNFNLTQWTDSLLYELCTNAAVYKAVEKTSAAGSV